MNEHQANTPVKSSGTSTRATKKMPSRATKMDALSLNAVGRLRERIERYSPQSRKARM